MSQDHKKNEFYFQELPSKTQTHTVNNNKKFKIYHSQRLIND